MTILRGKLRLALKIITIAKATLTAIKRLKNHKAVVGTVTAIYWINWFDDDIKARCRSTKNAKSSFEITETGILVSSETIPWAIVEGTPPYYGSQSCALDDRRSGRNIDANYRILFSWKYSKEIVVCFQSSSSAVQDTHLSFRFLEFTPWRPMRDQ